MNLTNTLALSERKGTYTLSKKPQTKPTSLHAAPLHSDNKTQRWNIHPSQNILSTPTNPTLQLLLDERIACMWTTVRMPIVHFSVLLVFKKFATHNTEQFHTQCAATQPSKPHPQNLAEHRSRISKVRKYILSKLSTEKGQYSFWINTHPDYRITYCAKI